MINVLVVLLVSTLNPISASQHVQQATLETQQLKPVLPVFLIAALAQIQPLAILVKVQTSLTIQP